MAMILTDSSHYANIAEAIREKTGATDTYKPAEMPDAIAAIAGAGEDTLALACSGRITEYSNDTLTTFTYPVFYGNTELNKINLPKVTSIPNYAFYGCTWLFDPIDFPIVKTIGDRAFQDCVYINNINFPEVETIGAYAFYRCSQLNSIDFPIVKTIGDRAFYECSGVTSINLPLVTSTGTYSFTRNSFSKVILPSATDIGQATFYNCSSLTFVDLPVATAIPSNTFFSCANLATLILRSNTMVTLDNTNAFTSTPIANNSSSGFIYVPSALVDTYKADSKWSTYKYKFRAIEDYPDICG